MQCRGSRTDMPRASPFIVRSSMEVTLLAVVYAGLQTAFDYRRRIRHLQVCPKHPRHVGFLTIGNAKKTTRARLRHHADLSRQDITWNDKLAFLRPARPVLPCYPEHWFLSHRAIATLS